MMHSSHMIQSALYFAIQQIIRVRKPLGRVNIFDIHALSSSVI